MTDIIETHGLRGATSETSGRKIWTAPRLIHLEDDNTDGKMPDSQEVTRPNGFMGFNKYLPAVS